MRKYLFLIFIIVSIFLYPHNLYAYEIIDIESYDCIYNLCFAIIGDTDTLLFPQTLTMYSSDGQTYEESIIWDDSNVDWQKEGYYILNGSISNAEKYNHIPDLSIGLSLNEKYDLFLQDDEISNNSITFSFQDSYGLKEHQLDLNHLHVWACEVHQYNQDQNWYDVTNHPNVHLTPTTLTIDGLDNLYGTELIYRIQISYDDPLYLQYSLSSTIMAFDNELFVSIYTSGDRNGGNREKQDEVIIPEETTHESNDTVFSDVQDNSIDISISDEKQTDNQMENEQVHNSSIQSNISQNKTSSLSTYQEKINFFNDYSYIINNNTDKSQPNYTKKKERTISAQTIEIHSQPSILIPIFVFIGIVVGVINIKKTYEEK